MTEIAAMSRIRSFLSSYLSPEEDDTPTVDTAYVVEQQERYQHMSATDAETGWCRCELCGRLYDLEEFPDLVEHVAGHNEQGAAEIDPFEHRRVEAVAEYSFIETVEPTGDRVENNEHKTETQTNV